MNKRLVNGTSSVTLSGGFDRDTTRGTSEVTFPTIAADQIKGVVHINNCDICGEAFEYSEVENRFCPDHAWLEGFFTIKGRK
jgi:hypothetical protein